MEPKPIEGAGSAGVMRSPDSSGPFPAPPRHPAIPFAIIAVVLLAGGAIYFWKSAAPPGISTVGAGEEYVPVSADIRFEFPHPEATAEDIGRHFSISPSATGTVSFDGVVVTFHSEKNLAYETGYTITITKGLPTGGEQTLAEDFTLPFRTRPRGEERAIQLQSYSSFQSFTANFYDQEIAVPVSVGGAGTYTFSLYRSSADDAIAAYAAPVEFDDDRSFRVKRKSYARGQPIDVQKVVARGGGGDREAPLRYVPAVSGPGIYYIEVASSADPETYAFFLFVTKSAVTTKRLGNDLVTWVVDAKNSSGVGEAQVTGIGEDPKLVLFREATDDNGIVRKSYPKGGSDPKPSVLVIERDGDVTLNFLTVGYYNAYTWDFEGSPARYTAYVYTDRPLYRPGDTVHWKAIVRERDGETYHPAKTEVTVSIVAAGYGENRDTLFERMFSTNANGSLADSYALSREVGSGTYEIQVKTAGFILSRARFGIEYYQKPEYEVSVSAERDGYAKGQPITATVSARYFFGGPLRHELVKIRAFNPGDYTIFETKGQLDGAGTLHVEIPTARVSIPEWYGGGDAFPITIEAVVIDPVGNAASGAKTVTLHDGELALALEEPAERWDFRTGRSYYFSFRAERIGSDAPVAGQVVNAATVRYRFGGYQRDEKKVQEFVAKTDASGLARVEASFPSGGSYAFVFSTKDSLGNIIERRADFWVAEGDVAGLRQNKGEFADQVIVTQDKKSYAIGDTAKIRLQLPRASGELFWSVNKLSFRRITVETIDGYFMELDVPIIDELAPGFFLATDLYHDDIFVQDTHFIEVTGKRLTVEVIPEHSVAFPGGEITLTVKTKDANGRPVAAESSLAVVDKALFALRSDSTTDIYDALYPDPPDQMVSTDSVRPVSRSLAEKGGCFTAGTKILMADGSEKGIEHVRPGDTIFARADAFSDRLVPDRVTKVFRHVVSEYWVVNGFLEITPVHRVFLNGAWQEIGKARVGDFLVDAAGEAVRVDSIERVYGAMVVYNLETERTHTFIANGIYVHNDKGEADEPRKNFVDTAYWNAFVVTGRNGEASLRVKLPDNLTTWTGLARAITADSKAGQGTGEFVVSKDLIIRPAVPQFFRNGDRIEIIAAVHNKLGRNGEFRALLRAEGATVIDESIHTVPVANGDVQDISWRIGVGAHREVTLHFSVEETGGSGRDAVILRVPVYSDFSPVRQSIGGIAPSVKTIAFDSAASRSYSSAMITLTPSVLATLPSIIEGLTGYPYGCVEQTMSHHLPNILVAKERSLLGLDPPGDLEKRLAEGFDRLAKFQHRDGGFGWWEDDENNVWMSGYVYEGLTDAKAAGFLGGREDLHRRIRDYFAGNIASFSREEQAYVAYVLSRAEAGSAREVIDRLAREVLSGVPTDPQSKGYVALSLHANGDVERARQVLARLMAEMRDNHWEMPENEEWDDSLKDAYSATGVSLLAMTKIDYNQATAAGIVQWLMQHRTGYEGLWGSTRQSAQILSALIEYLRRTDELKPNLAYEVFLNGERISGERMTSARNEVRYPIAIETLRPVNSIEVRKTGTGNLYWNLSLTSYLPGERIGGGAPGVTVRRQYVDLAGRPVTSFAAGDLIRVRVTVTTPKRLHYLIVEDFLPSTFAPQNPRLKNSISAGRGYDDNEFGDEFGDPEYDEFAYDYDSVDIRDERVGIFMNVLNPGSRTFEYVARVQYRGEATAPAPRAEPMYDPADYAFGVGSRIPVR